MHIVIFMLIVAALVFGPQLWAKSVLKRHSKHEEHYPGTGGELARHLLDRFGMPHVKVETTETGDHYDPVAKAVRLTSDKFKGKSLTAVTVAAHEVGHAIQDHSGYHPLKLRHRLVGVAQGAEKAGSLLMMGIPFIAILSQSPSAGLFFMLAALATFGVGTLVHLVTLPVELDASFRRALPVLKEGYISKQEQRAARHVLTACAFYLCRKFAGQHAESVALGCDFAAIAKRWRETATKNIEFITKMGT